MSIRQTEASPEEVLKRGQWRFEPKEAWDSISDEAKKFLKDGLLQPNPRMRASSTEALSHPWVASLAKPRASGASGATPPLGHGFRISSVAEHGASAVRGALAGPGSGSIGTGSMGSI